jgi:hypothetical protein
MHFYNKEYKPFYYERREYKYIETETILNPDEWSEAKSLLAEFKKKKEWESFAKFFANMKQYYAIKDITEIEKTEKQEIKKEIEKQKREKNFENLEEVRDYLEFCFNAKRIDPDYFDEKKILQNGNEFLCDGNILRKDLEKGFQVDTRMQRGGIKQFEIVLDIISFAKIFGEEKLKPKIDNDEFKNKMRKELERSRGNDDKHKMFLHIAKNISILSAKEIKFSSEKGLEIIS